ncbi:PWI domain-containing protein [Sporobolomyces koalae]|uniref:PWI domain-containing protein n=1 Tax=Sporobolomyces koalae TaxID=500713 RepID=UPI00317EFA52
MSFFKGTSTDQDPRFKDKQAMLLKKMSFPRTFDTKVDMRKVEITVMKPWIAKKVIELLGFEDDVLIEYINSLLEDQDNPVIDAKNLQILLTGFLEKKTILFMEPLWNLLLSAQSNPLRVPTELLEEKKREMRERAEQEAIKRRKEDELQAIRNRERDQRAGPGRGGFGGGDRGGFGGAGGRGGGRGGYGGGRDRFDDRERGDQRGSGYGGRGGFQGRRDDRERDAGYGPRGGPRDDYRVRILRPPDPTRQLTLHSLPRSAHRLAVVPSRGLARHRLDVLDLVRSPALVPVLVLVRHLDLDRARVRRRAVRIDDGHQRLLPRRDEHAADHRPRLQRQPLETAQKFLDAGLLRGREARSAIVM